MNKSLCKNCKNNNKNYCTTPPQWVVKIDSIVLECSDYKSNNLIKNIVNWMKKNDKTK